MYVAGPKVLLAVVNKENNKMVVDEDGTSKYRSIVYDNTMLYDLINELSDLKISSGSCVMTLAENEKNKLPMYMISDKISHKSGSKGTTVPAVVLAKVDGTSDTTVKTAQYMEDMILIKMLGIQSSIEKSANSKGDTKQDQELKWLDPILSGSQTETTLFFKAVTITKEDFRILSIWPKGYAENSVTIKWWAIPADDVGTQQLPSTHAS